MSTTKPSPGAVPITPGAPEHHSSSDAPRGHAVAQKSEAQKNFRKKKRGPGFWLAISIAFAGGGIWLVNVVHRAIVYEETDDAYVAGHLHMISSRLDGSVTEVLVDENQTVKAGQALARLDPLASEIAVDRNKAALHAAQAEVLQAQAAVDQAKAENAQAQAQVSVAAAQVQQSDAQLKLANANSGRDDRLFHEDTRTVSESEVDTSRSAAAASAAGLMAMKAGLMAAEARVRGGAAVIESAQARMASAKAKLEAEQEAVLDAERELSYTTISAPKDGRIGNKNVEVGNRVQVGQALFALVERDYWVTGNFKETQLRKMSMGQPVEITLDAVGGHRFTGTIASIAPATGAEFALLPPDNATGNFTKVVQRVPVKIVFDPNAIAGFEDRLSPGLSAVISVKIK